MYTLLKSCVSPHYGKNTHLHDSSYTNFSLLKTKQSMLKNTNTSQSIQSNGKKQSDGCYIESMLDHSSMF